MKKFEFTLTDTDDEQLVIILEDESIQKALDSLTSAGWDTSLITSIITK